MKEIKDYKLIAVETPTGLTKKVQEAMVEGWTPFYGIAVSNTALGNNVKTIYAQAVVQYID